MDEAIRNAAETVWDYMKLGEPVHDADCLLVIGSLNDDVAVYAANVEKEHTFRTVVISGGVSRITQTRLLGWGEDSEAEHYLKVMRRAGCSRKDILLEKAAKNTGDNAAFTYELLKARGSIPETLLVVSKPYMERRTSATFDIQWPDRSTSIRTTSPSGSLWQYAHDAEQQTYTINVMVGDLQRIIEYPKFDLQSEQIVPDAVMVAFEALIAAGYTRHLIKSM